MLIYTKNFLLLLTLPLLCGFFWPKAEWQSVNKLIDKLYPSVASISTDTLNNQLEHGKELTIIDVRPAEEYKISHLPGAINVTDVKRLKIPKNTEVIVYCSVGIRSARFAKSMSREGYKYVFNLRGSIFEWANKGYPLMRGDQSVKVVHPYSSKWGRLLNAPFHAYTIDE